MKRILRVVAILLMLACLLVLITSGTIVAQAEIIEYSMTDKKAVKPQPNGYLSDWTYEDPSISVSIATGRIHETNYMYAYVKLANGTQIRSAMSGSYYSPSTILGTSMVRNVNAVFAINGDYFSSRNGVGYVARMGKEYRNRCNGEYDVLVINDLGDLHIVKLPGKADMEAFTAQLQEAGRTVANGYTFGPGFVIDGVVQADFMENMDADAQKAIAANKPAQHMCIAQVGPLEYLCICAEGPEDKGSTGLTLTQFAELVTSFEGIIDAYNLDGGSSTHMILHACVAVLYGDERVLRGLWLDSISAADEGYKGIRQQERTVPKGTVLCVSIKW